MQEDCVHSEQYWFLGAFDAVDVVPMCSGNNEKSWGWWLTNVILTWHMNNRNGSASDLAARNLSFWHRASSPGVMVRIVQGLLTVSAV